MNNQAESSRKGAELMMRRARTKFIVRLLVGFLVSVIGGLSMAIGWSLWPEQDLTETQVLSWVAMSGVILIGAGIFLVTVGFFTLRAGMLAFNAYRLFRRAGHQQNRPNMFTPDYAAVVDLTQG